MPRSTGNVVEQNFIKGLITEASGMNFPENAATDALNVVFDRNGQVYRRLGIDVESTDVGLAFDPSDGAVNEFLWRSVARSGLYTFLVMQIGTSISIFKLEGNIALGVAQPFTVSLADYKTAGSPPIKDTLCNFASGAGRLFVTHPSCDPIAIEYDEFSNSITATPIFIKIRDFEGVEDGLEVDERPDTLTQLHLYNLKNQGWHSPTTNGYPNQFWFLFKAIFGDGFGPPGAENFFINFA